MARYSKRKDNDKSQYVGVSIPRTLAEEAGSFIKDMGYVSLSDLLRDLLREWIRNVTAYGGGEIPTAAAGEESRQHSSSASGKRRS